MLSKLCTRKSTCYAQPKMCITMWIMWISRKTCGNIRKIKGDKLFITLGKFSIKNAGTDAKRSVPAIKSVFVLYYLPKSCSPMLTTSPAPMVISKIPFCTIGKKIILDLVKCREVFTWSAKRLDLFLQILRGNSQSVCFPCSINICQYHVVCQSQCFVQTPEEELWYGYMYEAGIHTIISDVDNYVAACKRSFDLSWMMCIIIYDGNTCLLRLCTGNGGLCL